MIKQAAAPRFWLAQVGMSSARAGDIATPGTDDNAINVIAAAVLRSRSIVVIARICWSFQPRLCRQSLADLLRSNGGGDRARPAHDGRKDRGGSRIRRRQVYSPKIAVNLDEICK